MFLSKFTSNRIFCTRNFAVIIYRHLKGVDNFPSSKPLFFYKKKNFKMKRTILMLWVAVALASCKKDTPVEAAPALPAATQSGKNTMGCKINGELFLLNGKRDSWDVGLWNMEYSIEGDSTHNTIFINSRDPKISVIMVFSESNLKNVGTYALNGIYAFDNYYAAVTDSRAGTRLGGDGYETNQNTTGKIIITKNTPYFISGTFEFEAILDGEDSTKSVKVTEGRFDIEK